MILCFIMTSPSPHVAHEALMQYHGFVLGVMNLAYLKGREDMQKEYQSKVRRLADRLKDLRSNLHQRNSLACFLNGYEFDFEKAGDFLKAIRKGPYSELELREFYNSLPTMQTLASA